MKVQHQNLVTNVVICALIFFGGMLAAAIYEAATERVSERVSETDDVCRSWHGHRIDCDQASGQ